MTFEPMRPSSGHPKRMVYPVLLQEKLNGIRCIVTQNNTVITRSMKSIPNRHITNTLQELGVQGFDGEILTYNTDGTTRSIEQIQSDVMTKDGRPLFRFHVFDDCTHPHMPAMDRISRAARRVKKLDNASVEFVATTQCANAQRVSHYEEKFKLRGAEGIVLRSLYSRYYFGKAPTSDCIKMKQRRDAEAVVVGYSEKKSNQNPAKLAANGRVQRSKSKAGMTRCGTLGSLTLETPEGTRFNLGSGFSADRRQELWRSRHKLLGRAVTYSYAGTTKTGKPIGAAFLRIRDNRDLIAPSPQGTHTRSKGVISFVLGLFRLRATTPES